MLIAHISDLHIAGSGDNAYGVVPTAENLARCIKHINQLKPAPDLVLVTGDITYAGLAKEAEQAAKLLEQLRAPFYIIPGNHDERSILWSVFGGKACPSRDREFINYVIDDYEIRFIGVDSTAPGQPGGEICNIRADWLDEQLSKAKEQPTIIFMHHPPVKCGVLETDEDGFVGADLFGEIIGKYSCIERILCGHIHLNTHVGWQGTIITTTSSMGLELVLDLTLQQPSRFFKGDPGFHLHYWSPQKQLISHAVSLHKTEGPYRFEMPPMTDKIGI